MFEWMDGNPGAEDRVGYFVTPDYDDQGRITFASNNDEVIGIVSGTPGYTADTAAKAWQGINLKDEFGRAITSLSYKQPIIRILHAQIVTVDGAEISLYTLIAEYLNTLADDSTLPALVISWLTDHGHITNDLTNAITDAGAVQVHVVNPDYDPSLPYIGRAGRKEWSPVGWQGKIVVRDDGKCTTIPGRCDCGPGGKAVPGTKWRILKRNSPNTILIWMQ